MKNLINYRRIKLGTVNKEGIYLSPPSWDCGWYWGFGYLGNKNCHYHVDGLDKNINLKDAIDNHFGKSYIIRPSQRWVVAKLFENFYDLKKAAYILEKGGSHLTTSPCFELIKNVTESKRINEIVIPAIFEELYKIIYDNYDNNSDYFEQMDKYVMDGNLNDMVTYMFKIKFTPDDIKDRFNLEYREIHSIYWKLVHSK